MNKKVLQTPISDADVEELRAGDVIYLTGRLVTGRDDVHMRVVGQGRPMPADVRGGAVFHAGPIMREKAGEPGKFEVVSVGPTTSMRMEEFEAEFIEKTGVKLIIGKGGMGEKTAEGCRKFKAVHAVFPGGCAVLAAGCVEEVEGVEWADLGMPEAVWVLRVREFGPLVVSIDTQGGNLFAANRAVFAARKDAITPEICGKVGYAD